MICFCIVIAFKGQSLQISFEGSIKFLSIIKIPRINVPTFSQEPQFPSQITAHHHCDPIFSNVMRYSIKSQFPEVSVALL